MAFTDCTARLEAHTEWPAVEILMATYNGAPFIRAQIESILSQTYRNWHLMIHDDGSSDGTAAIVQEYVHRFPSQITMLQDFVICGSAKSNFAHLMAESKADYVMFSDQDDVWMPNKVEISMRQLLSMEARRGRDIPLGVFTDLVVVDEQLKVIAPSFWAFQNFRPEMLLAGIENLAARNCITGCTLLLNRSALAVCLPIPDVAVMHDWWCGLKILHAHGTLVPMRVATVQYRQHSRNLIGAKKWARWRVILKLLRFHQYRKDFIANYKMAKRIVPTLDVISFSLRKIKQAFTRCKR